MDFWNALLLKNPHYDFFTYGFDMDTVSSDNDSIQLQVSECDNKQCKRNKDLAHTQECQQNSNIDQNLNKDQNTNPDQISNKDQISTKKQIPNKEQIPNKDQISTKEQDPNKEQNHDQDPNKDPNKDQESKKDKNLARTYDLVQPDNIRHNIQPDVMAMIESTDLHTCIIQRGEDGEDNYVIEFSANPTITRSPHPLLINNVMIVSRLLRKFDYSDFVKNMFSSVACSFKVSILLFACRLSDCLCFMNILLV